MALYAETGGHVAKRPRVDFHNSAATLAAAGGNAGNPTALQIAAAGAGILSQQYIEQQLTRRSQEPEKPNHILLFTVLNPTYPITCEVLNTICSPIGSVLRIVIFKKNGVQAMVEFDAVDTAKSAKENLHGCDVYSGCCTLKVEYAKPTKLNVYRNDSDSWDYTNPNLGKERQADLNISSQPVSQRPVLLKEPLQPKTNGNSVHHVSAATLNHAAGLINGNNSLTAQSIAASIAQQQALLAETAGFENGFGTSVTNVPTTQQQQIAAATTLAGLESFATSTASSGLTTISSLGRAQAINAATLAGQNAAATLLTRGGAPILATPLGLTSVSGATVANPGGLVATSATTGALTTQHQGSVCMVYGLNADKMNANRIFNLFCLYGNVVRVKFLKTKEGCAMVQMGDALAVERVVSNLNNTSFFGSKMQLGFSKQAFLADVQAPYQLSDGTPSFQDFMGSKNNRFINPEMASKNRIQPPSKILHFFNTPPGLESKDVEELFTEHGSPAPKCVKLFPSKTERSSSGLIEFETLGDALEALVSCNHQPVPNPNGKFPYIMKLCFSSSRSIPTTIRMPTDRIELITAKRMITE
jgi:heterogeneous nuclear ribonucleoprotein L